MVSEERKSNLQPDIPTANSGQANTHSAEWSEGEAALLYDQLLTAASPSYFYKTADGQFSLFHSHTHTHTLTHTHTVPCSQ